MALINRKKNIFNTIGSIKSLDSNKKRTDNTLSSLNNKNNPQAFLMDLLVVLVGSAGLFVFIGKIISNLFDKTKTPVNEAILNKSNTIHSDTPISNTNFKNGITVKVSDIDLFNKFKINPNSSQGEKIYDIDYNDSDKFFDYKLYQIINGLNTDNTIGNINVIYNNDNDSLFISAIDTNNTYYEFNENYLNNDNNITKKTFTNNVIDSIFGVNNKTGNKTKEQIIRELEYKKKLEKISNNLSFELSDSEIKDIEFNAENLKNGVKYNDWCCGYYESNISENTLKDLLNNIDDDEYDLSTSLNNIFNESMGDNNSNKDASKDNFAKDVVRKSDSEIINSFLLTPKMMIYDKIKQKINKDTIDNNFDNFLVENDDTIKCISNKTRNIINESLFGLVKKELNNLIVPYAKSLLKEKSNQYISILKSLVNFT